MNFQVEDAVSLQGSQAGCVLAACPHSGWPGAGVVSPGAGVGSPVGALALPACLAPLQPQNSRLLAVAAPKGRAGILAAAMRGLQFATSLAYVWSCW